MMDRLIFDEDHEMFRDATRRFMQAEIEPHVERWRQQGRCDKEAFIKAGEQGLLGMWVPEEYGGPGIEDFRFEQIVIEEGAKLKGRILIGSDEEAEDRVARAKGAARA